MKIKQRLESQSTYTDIIAFDAFQNEATGFLMAWLFTQVDGLTINKAVFSVTNGESGTAKPQTVALNVPLHKLSMRWQNQDVKTIIIASEYKGTSLAIQLQMEQRLCSFEYPKTKIDVPVEVARDVDERSRQHLAFLLVQEQKEMGSCMYAHFLCRHLKGVKEALHMTETILSMPDCIIRWYLFLLQEDSESIPRKTIAKSEKLSAECMLNMLPDETLDKVKIDMIWQGREIKIIILPSSQTVDIYFDKWLGTKRDRFLYLLNVNLYSHFLAAGI